MLLDQSSWNLPIAETDEHKQWANHPLSPLTPAEISRTTDLITALYPPGTDLQFKAVTLEEPEKARVVTYLDAEHHGRETPSMDRKSFVSYYLRNTVRIRIQSRMRDHGDGSLTTGDAG